LPGNCSDKLNVVQDLGWALIHLLARHWAVAMFSKFSGGAHHNTPKIAPDLLVVYWVIMVPLFYLCLKLANKQISVFIVPVQWNVSFTIDWLSSLRSRNHHHTSLTYCRFLS
jgi:hypothetical protein